MPLLIYIYTGSPPPLYWTSLRNRGQNLSSMRWNVFIFLYDIKLVFIFIIFEKKLVCNKASVPYVLETVCVSHAVIFEHHRSLTNNQQLWIKHVQHIKNVSSFGRREITSTKHESPPFVQIKQDTHKWINNNLTWPIKKIQYFTCD